MSGNDSASAPPAVPQQKPRWLFLGGFFLLVTVYDGCGACFSISSNGLLPQSMGWLALLFLLATPVGFVLWLVKRRSPTGRIWLARWLMTAALFLVTVLSLGVVGFNEQLNAKRKASGDSEELAPCDELARVAPALDERDKHRVAIKVFEERPDKDAPAVREIRDAYVANARRGCTSSLESIRAYATRWNLTDEEAVRRLGWGPDGGVPQ